MDEAIWSLASPRLKRISGSKNFRSLPRKDFCNNIDPKRTLRHWTRAENCIPSAGVVGDWIGHEATRVYRLVGGAAVWPLAAQGQQAATRVIGVLALESLARTRASLAPAQRRLAEMGFVEGQNLAFEYRAADNQEDRLAELVGDLVQRRVSVIVAPAGPSFVAAKAATTSIPIIFFTGFDPVSSGFVASLNRPGGNATGISVLHTEVVAKRLELLRELVPRAKSVAYLRSSTVGQLITFAFSPSSTSRRQLSNIASAKRPKSGRPGPQ